MSNALPAPWPELPTAAWRETYDTLHLWTQIAGKIRFGAIARLVEATLEAWHRSGNLAPLASADDAISVDHAARNKAATLLPQIAAKAS